MALSGPELRALDTIEAVDEELDYVLWNSLIDLGFPRGTVFSDINVGEEE